MLDLLPPVFELLILALYRVPADASENIPSSVQGEQTWWLGLELPATLCVSIAREWPWLHESIWSRCTQRRKCLWECVLHYGNGGLCVSCFCIRSQSLKGCAHVADRIGLNSVPSHLGIGYLTESVRPGWSWLPGTCGTQWAPHLRPGPSR